MTTSRIPRALERLVRERAKHRCEYCQASEWLTGQTFEIDHIQPRVRGGETVQSNLCLACSGCNSFKQDRTSGINQATGQSVLLFNPREHRWADHFVWSEDGTQIVGLTDIGRITIERLKMNRPLAVSARSIWVAAGRHPPKD